MGTPAFQALCTQDFLARLRSALDRHAVYARAPRLTIAFSGGLDSTVALRALVEIESAARVRAVHVDHGLHVDSLQWAAFCGQQARSLGVAFESRRVEVDTDAGYGVEAAAREARYDVLCNLLGRGEVLVTAHHGDDQLETVLLRLLRGTGVKGLAAIAELRPYGAGFLGRPLLGFSRAEMRAQAKRWSLDWIEDPSNRESLYDRNFLRQEVIPQIEARWPAATHSAVRLAAHMRDAEDNLAALAKLDLGSDAASGSVARTSLRNLSPARQRNALRWLIQGRGLSVPNSSQLEQLRESLAVTRPDAAIRVAWPGAEVRVYRDKLYFLAPDVIEDAKPRGRLVLGQTWEGGALGRLTLAASDGEGLPEDWLRDGIEIRFRQGGERFKPLHSAHSKPLKQWLHEAQIVPWMRDRIPLLYRHGQLIAIADLCLHDDLRKHQADTCLWRVNWHGHPPIR